MSQGILDVGCRWPCILAHGWPAHTTLPGALCLVGAGDQQTLVATGLLDDPRGELSRAQVFIQSSDTEGMSNALLEAMASGCACVATDVGETRFVLGGRGISRSWGWGIR